MKFFHGFDNTHICPSSRLILIRCIISAPPGADFLRFGTNVRTDSRMDWLEFGYRMLMWPHEKTWIAEFMPIM